MKTYDLFLLVRGPGGTAEIRPTPATVEAEKIELVMNDLIESDLTEKLPVELIGVRIVEADNGSE